MKEYILNIKFGTWQNQLWFMNSDNDQTREIWINAIQEIDNLKSSYNNSMDFQAGVIEYLKKLGFIRIQK